MFFLLGESVDWLEQQNIPTITTVNDKEMVKIYNYNISNESHYLAWKA